MSQIQILVFWTIGLCIIGGVAIIEAFRANRPESFQRQAASGLDRYLHAPTSTEIESKDNRRIREIRMLLQRSVGKRIARTEAGGRLALQLERAGLNIRPAEALVMIGGVALALAVLMYLRFQSPTPAVLAPVVVGGGFYAWLSNRISRRRKAFDAQIDATVMAIANALRTGSGIMQALEAIGQTSNAPMGDELKRAVRKINLNVSPFEALMDVSGRNESPEFETIARAVAITQHTGGSLADVLDRVGDEIREQIRVKGEVRVLTAQGRASALVVGIMPFAIGGLLFLIEPQYFGPMLTNPLGVLMMAASFILVGMGLIVIRAMARIEV